MRPDAALAARSWTFDLPAWTATWHRVGLPDAVARHLPPILDREQGGEGGDGLLSPAEAVARLEADGALHDGRPSEVLAQAVLLATTGTPAIEVTRRGPEGLTQAIFGLHGMVGAGITVHHGVTTSIVVETTGVTTLLDLVLGAADLDDDVDAPSAARPVAEEVDLTQILAGDPAILSGWLAGDAGDAGELQVGAVLIVLRGAAPTTRTVVLDTPGGPVTTTREGTTVRLRPTDPQSVRDWMVRGLAVQLSEAAAAVRDADTPQTEEDGRA